VVQYALFIPVHLKMFVTFLLSGLCKGDTRFSLCLCVVASDLPFVCHGVI